MFIKNKYYRWYQELCSSRKALDRNKKEGIYYEGHHIIPKSFGGSNKKSNIVLLTPKEHFVAHLLLVNCTSNKERRKMVRAIILMGGKTKIYKCSRQYHKLREEFSEMQKLKSLGKNNPMYGKTHTSQVKEKLSKHQSGKNNNFYGKAHSKEYIQRQREINLGHLNPNYGNPNNYEHDDIAKKKISNHHKNKPKSKNHIQKMKKDRSIGTFFTPWGNFSSAKEAERSIPLSDTAVLNLCIKNNHKIITPQAIGRLSCLLLLFSKENILGKTWHEIGFKFLPVGCY